MKGDKKVIEYLNGGLKRELTAINQYFLHARMLDDWGVTKMAKHEYQESIEEMQHADNFIKRILFLEGLPNLQELGKLYIGQDVKEVLECDLKLEMEGISYYKEAIAHAESVKDFVTRDMFQKILNDEEGHADHLETQLGLIKTIGLEKYVLLNSGAQEAGDH